MFDTFCLKRLITVPILDHLHDFRLSLICKFVDLLLEFGLIHKMIVILHGEVTFLDYYYLFVIVKVIRFLIDLCIPILIDDWLDMHFFDMVGNVWIVPFAHHTVDLLLHLRFFRLFEKVRRSRVVLGTEFELLFAAGVVIDCLDGPLRRKVRGVDVLYIVLSLYCAPSFNLSRITIHNYI